MLMRFDPFRELDRFAQQAWGARGGPMAMPMDAYRQGDRFVIDLDLPGVDPDSIDLTVEKNVLTVSATRTARRGGQGEARGDGQRTEGQGAAAQRGEAQQVVVSERPQGTFSRQLFLAESLDTQRIEACYENGVLTVTIPIAEQAKPRKVAISAGSTSAQTIEASSQPA